MLIDNRVSHLSNSEIDKLINEYYLGEHNEVLINKYNINVSSGLLFTVFPPKQLDINCPYCNSHLVEQRLSKSQIRYNKKALIYCMNCGHEDNNEDCNCVNCKSKNTDASELRRNRIINAHNSEGYNKVNPLEMSFKHKIFLGALLKHSLSEDMKIIYSMDSVNKDKKPLAPTSDMTTIILHELSNANIIIPDVVSSVEHFNEIVGENGIYEYNYYTYRVNYLLNIEMDEYERFSIITQLLNPAKLDLNNMDPHDVKVDDIVMLWENICLNECLEYMEYQMKLVNFNFDPKGKIVPIFNYLLDYFSVSQIYGIIYRSIANATRYFQEGNISRQHASNTAVANCESFGLRAIEEGWDLQKYSRIKELPQSSLSEYFFYSVVNVGYDGFDKSHSYFYTSTYE